MTRKTQRAGSQKEPAHRDWKESDPLPNKPHQTPVAETGDLMWPSL